MLDPYPSGNLTPLSHSHKLFLSSLVKVYFAIAIDDDPCNTSYAHASIS
jgi:hypothetical protein